VPLLPLDDVQLQTSPALRLLLPRALQALSCVPQSSLLLLLLLLLLGCWSASKHRAAGADCCCHRWGPEGQCCCRPQGDTHKKCWVGLISKTHTVTHRRTHKHASDAQRSPHLP
jgi:hypothetical protein